MMPAIGPTAPWWWQGANAIAAARPPAASAASERVGPAFVEDRARRSRPASARTCRAQAIGGPACRIVSLAHARQRLARDADAVEHRLRRQVARRTPSGWPPRRVGCRIKLRERGRRRRDRPGRAAPTRAASPAPPALRDRSRRTMRGPTLTTWSSCAERAASSRSPRASAIAGREPQRAAALLAASSTPAVPQGRFLTATGSAGRRRCRRRSRRRRPAACPSPRGPGPRRSPAPVSAAGSRMRAVAEHDVEQDHRDRRVGGLLAPCARCAADGRSSGAGGRA